MDLRLGIDLSREGWIFRDLSDQHTLFATGGEDFPWFARGGNLRGVAKGTIKSYAFGRNDNALARPLTIAFFQDTLMDNLFNL